MAEWIEIKIEPCADGYGDISRDPAVKTEPPDADIKTEQLVKSESVEDDPLGIDGDDVYSDVKNEPADAVDVCFSEVASAEGSPAAATVKQEMDIEPTDIRYIQSTSEPEPIVKDPLTLCSRTQRARVELKSRNDGERQFTRDVAGRLDYPPECTDDRPYHCDVCSKTFARKHNLNVHMLTHSGARPHICDVCQKGFFQTSHLRTHMVTHSGARPISCGVCKKSFSQKCYLRVHMFTHSGARPYSCDVCKKSFSTNSYLKDHMLTHSDARSHRCNICQKGFSLKSSLRVHMFTHSGARPHSCEVCQKGFIQKSHLKSHMYTHSGARPYNCDICQRGFFRKAGLRAHMLTHSGARP